MKGCRLVVSGKLLLPIVLGILTVLSLNVGAVGAEDPGFYQPDPETPRINASASVQSTASGVIVRITVQQTSAPSPGTEASTNSGSGGSSTSDSDWDCRVDVMNVGQAIRPWIEENAPLHPGTAPAGLSCTNGYFDVVWLPAGTDTSEVTVVVDSGLPPVDPLILAAELLNEIPVPDIAIGVNPSTGLVAVPSWFWIDGYDGTAIVESASLGGVTVEVEVMPTAFHWRFGDGRELSTASLGMAYPEASDIAHTYEQSSLAAGGAYPVSVELTFAARYRVVGEDWQDLDPITRSFDYEYPVRQLQSILTAE